MTVQKDRSLSPSNPETAHYDRQHNYGKPKKFRTEMPQLRNTFSSCDRRCVSFWPVNSGGAPI